LKSIFLEHAAPNGKYPVVAMYKKSFFNGRELIPDKLEHFLLVPMRGKTVHQFDFCIHLPGFTKKFDLLDAVPQHAPRGIGRAISNNQDGVFGVFDIIGQVVPDPAGIGHTGGRDDDAGFIRTVQGLGLFNAFNVMKPLKPNGFLSKAGIHAVPGQNIPDVRNTFVH
jgi:hypothetical protein